MCDNCGTRQGKFIKHKLYMTNCHNTSFIISVCKDIGKCNKRRDVIDAEKITAEKGEEYG